MLKCVQEASEKLKIGDFCKSKPSPRHSTADKGTQTVLSAYKGKTQQSKNTQTRQSGTETSQSVSTSDKGKHVTRRIPYTTKTTAGGTTTNEHITASRTSPSIRQSKSAVADRNRSKTPCSSILQPTKGRTQKGRRVSTGDCEKRTPASCTDSDLANWLKNPVYASDGESEGRRTDRSEMSPPWLDISMVQKIARQRRSDSVSMSTAIQKATSRKNKSTSKSRASMSKMELIPEKGQEVNPREEPTAVGDVKPPERNLTETDLTIRRIIEGKLGRRYEELDSKSLKLISKERMKELASKYAGDRPKVHLADRDIPDPSVSHHVPQGGKLNDPRKEGAQRRS